MNKKKSNELVFYIKVDSNDDIKNKKNIQNTNQNNRNIIYSKKKKIDEDNFKLKKISGLINDDTSPTKETLNTPSNNKNKYKSKDKEKENVKNKTNIKNNNIKSIPKKEKYDEDIIDTNNNKVKKYRYDTFESFKKIDDDDLVTSFERNPSELKSPETISENSFISSFEEYEIPKNFEKRNNKDKSDTKEEKINEKNKSNSHLYSGFLENELIYVDNLNYAKESDEEYDNYDNYITEKSKKKNNNTKMIKICLNKKLKKNINIPKINTKEKSILEKELKEIERDKKKEKFKNIEIKTKTTTRHSSYVVGENLNNDCKNKINQKELNKKNKEEISSSNINNIKKLNKNNINEKQPYIPVNQRKKLLINKKCIDLKTKDISKTNSLNMLESNLAKFENNKKNEKLSLTNIKINAKSIFGKEKININTEEKTKYKKKYINGNYFKDINNNTDELNLENLDYNKGIITNRIEKESKNDLEKDIFNNLSYTIEISKDLNQKIKNKKEDNENSNENKDNKIDNKLVPKKNSVMNNKAINNKLDKFKTRILSNNIIYEPKKLGVIRVKSSEKKSMTPLYNNMSYDPNQYLDNKIKDTLSSINSNNINNINNISNEKNNDSKNILEEYIFRKKSKNYRKKYIELNNSFTCLDNKYNFGLLNNPMINNFNNNNISNFNTILNSSYERKKPNYSLRNSNHCHINNKINTNHLILNKTNNKNNYHFSNFSNLLNKNEGFSLNTGYENSSQNNNLFLNNNIPQNLIFHHNNSYDFGNNETINNCRSQTQLINLIGNNFIGPNIVQNNLINNLKDSFGNNNNPNSINFGKIFPNNFNINNLEQKDSNSLSINFEDLIILQEYLKEIIISLEKKKVIENECFEYWNYYYNSSICCQIEKLFKNQLDSHAVRISINYTLMSIMLCYDYSFENELLNKVNNTLSDIIKLNYKNLMLICEHILSKITKESLSNIWVLKLSSIINSSNYNDYNQYLMNGYNMTIVERISYNTNIIVQNLRYLLKNFKSSKNISLTSIFKKMREKTYEEINIFFRENILRIKNLNGSILGSIFLLKNKNFRTLPAPYVRTKNNKEFSLVLDLDETLIHFKPKNNGEEGGILRVRPGINEFLEEVGKYYELILFTTATQDYADILIDAIEEDKIYFDHRLYREHAVIIDNDFVKDLTRIGRPLDKIIIVDNMPQNFRLQKENGIIIKAFWGEDNYDRALYDLYPILANIAKEGEDVRKSLVKYKDEIIKNVTCCISKVEA